MSIIDPLTGAKMHMPFEWYSEPWHKWFAWYPVTVHDKRIWLKTVYRKNMYMFGVPRSPCKTLYGTLFDVLSK
jgi:hypothetical protein